MRDFVFMFLILAAGGGVLYLAISHPTYTPQQLFFTFWQWYLLGAVVLAGAYQELYGRDR